MRFLNPKTDLAFKKIFGSEKSKDILLSFLNTILELESPYCIADLDILDPYLAPKIVGMKDTYVDVRAVDETGRHYIIEMQVLNLQGFEQRVLYNACKTYASQIHKGEDYRMLTDVIALTITDFTLFPERDGVIHKFKLRAEDGDIYSDDLELVFAELPKFTKSEPELVSIQDKWFYFLQHAEDLTMVPAVMENDAPLLQAFDIANRAGMTEEEMDMQERREMFIQDQRGAIEKALEVGEARGEARGRLEGKLESVRQIAVSLLPVLDDAGIAAATGLGLEAVRALRESV